MFEGSADLKNTNCSLRNLVVIFFKPNYRLKVRKRREKLHLLGIARPTKENYPFNNHQSPNYFLSHREKKNYACDFSLHVSHYKRNVCSTI